LASRLQLGNVMAFAFLSKTNFIPFLFGLAIIS
jgi:hypothetical protein